MEQYSFKKLHRNDFLAANVTTKHINFSTQLDKKYGSAERDRNPNKAWLDWVQFQHGTKTIKFHEKTEDKLNITFYSLLLTINSGPSRRILEKHVCVSFTISDESLQVYCRWKKHEIWIFPSTWDLKPEHTFLCTRMWKWFYRHEAMERRKYLYRHENFQDNFFFFFFFEIIRIHAQCTPYTSYTHCCYGWKLHLLQSIRAS